MKENSKLLFGGLKALRHELEKDVWCDAKFTILLDENTFQHCLPLLISQVEALQEADFIEVPVGEECKTLEVAAQVWQTLLEGEADRNAVIVNLGGGCVCDLGGFVSAVYKRGIRHINIPTTLLAMVDASIGGKTAVNFGGVKNSIGQFYTSAVTIIDPVFLATLPPEEIFNGEVEMVKTATVTDAGTFYHFLSNSNALLVSVKPVVQVKQSIVKADPYDQGARKILNFGHTFGHAIERYSNLPHGVAVGIGMLAAMYLSVKKIGFDEEAYLSYSKWIKGNIKMPAYTLKDIEQMLSLMHQDKKNANGSVCCVLLQELGAAMIDVEVSDNEIRDAFLKLK